jgi:hypothetical protein
LGGWARFLEAIYYGLVVLFLAYTVALILRGLFAQKVILADHVVGAVCGYLLAGLAWAALYMLVETVQPGSVRVSPEIAWQLADEHTRRYLFHYFSFETLTTVGYGDVTPVRPAACSLVWLEAVFGQFYLAVIVAQLVGLKLAQAVQKSNTPPD